MPKVLLAEDDANLREIFEMRLRAEGFDVLTAGDGEEALVVATREKPDLMVVDIMMPKISGFEMLETLRANPETANIKAIMMTALGQAEDRERGEKLGVLKYLVKSQVTLEDFVRTIRDILGANQTNNQRSNMDDQTNPNPTPANDASAPVDNSTPTSSDGGMTPTTPPADDAMPMAEERSAVDSQMGSFTPPTAPAPEPTMPAEEPAATPAAEPTMPAEEPAATPAAEPEAPAADTPPAAEPGETIEPTSDQSMPPQA